jgi:hypothetical protein
MEKLSIQNEMSVFDKKDRTFYDNLTDEERKKFSTFLMIRWGSSIAGSRELQEYYVQSTNHYLNKHFFALSRHPKLQWLMATAVSPGMGTHRHNWIAPKKKETTSGSSAMRKQLAELFPNMKADELDVMVTITTKKELDSYIKAHGNDK